MSTPAAARDPDVIQASLLSQLRAREERKRETAMPSLSWLKVVALVVLATVVWDGVAAARLHRRAMATGLSSDSGLTEQQVTSIRGLLNNTANKRCGQPPPNPTSTTSC